MDLEYLKLYIYENMDNGDISENCGNEMIGMINESFLSLSPLRDKLKN